MRAAACPSCQQRKAKRACPALDRLICPVCCGTKRRTEIPCPDHCPYLATARAHPAAVLRRRRARDLGALAGLLGDLSEQQAQLLWGLQQFLDTRRTGLVPPLADRDVAEAAGALAATLETAARGIIYEHQPRSLSARRLVVEMHPLVEQAQRDRRLERDAIVVLRRLERAACEARTTLEDSPTAYLDFVRRLLEEAEPARRGPVVSFDGRHGP